MATPLKKQYPVEATSLYGKDKCRACGNVVQILFSKSGAAYYNCYNTDAKTGIPCQHHERWGGLASRNMRYQYLVAIGEIQPVKVQKDQTAAPPADPPANTNAAPATGDTKPKEKDAYDYFGN